MPKSKVVKVKQEQVDQIEKDRRKGLHELVSEAIQHRLEQPVKQGILERQERARIVGVRDYTCINDFVHHIKVVKYDDSSVWVMCPMFGWFEDVGSEGTPKLGCKERKKRCTWFMG